MIKQLVESAAIVGQLEAKTKDAALKELVQAAQAAGIFPKKTAAVLGKKLSERESIGSTGLGNGVAVPHVKHDDVAQTALVLARTKPGIEWQSIDGRPVHIVFFVVSPTEDPESHLQCLRWISTLARNADFRRFLLDARDDAQIRELLRELLPKA
jgi:PTS system fructose-specific IIA component/PTS system nitrogen regulatory IIA component